MDNFSTLSVEDRKNYFEVAARQIGIGEQIVEKDFWVCWTLKRLFSLQPLAESLIFKGGTSLSKVFNVIERFSEDVDISVNRKVLGFVDLQDPEQAKSTKQQTILIEKLSDACRAFVRNTIQVGFEKDVERLLGSKDWTVKPDPADKDGQTLLFYYPSVFNLDGYIRGMVRIEIGARSDHWPVHVHPVRPYVADRFSDVFKEPNANVRVLDAARTFWEKATILHKYAHLPEAKQVTARQSRHYYDFYRLLGSPYKQEALSNLELLKRVSIHKQIYFRAAWAKYEEAVPGTLKLIPSQRVSDAMMSDYSQMGDMFFGSQPSWETILETIRNFETEINSAQSAK